MFVTFEGLDGSGKSTQVELLRAALAAEGRSVVTTREPGGTALGERLRALLLDQGRMSGWAEALLFAAARAELVERVIAPALERGGDVLCDRYLDSSLAYQGIARGLGVEAVLELNRPGTRDLLPDVTFLLLLDPAEAMRRGAGPGDRIEREGEGFRRSVDRAYRELARRYPARIVALDATGPPDTIAEQIHAELRQRS